MRCVSRSGPILTLYEIAARLAAGTSVTTGKVVPATYEKRYPVSPNILVTSGDSDDVPINRRFLRHQYRYSRLVPAALLPVPAGR
jgi:hypothetical protein